MRRGVRRGHDRHDRSRGCPNAPWTAYGGRAQTSFHVWNESRSEGRLFGPQGRMPSIGLWAVGTNEPHARDKTVHGRRRRRMAADMDKFPHLGRKPSREALIQLTGANAAYWPTGGRGESHSPETSVQSPIPAFGRMLPVCRTVECPLTETACIHL